MFLPKVFIGDPATGGQVKDTTPAAAGTTY